jgi:hypothetical protein
VSYSIPGIDKTPAYAEFDKSGNYVCNPFERSLETNIYIDTVNKINDKMTTYTRTNPNATMLEQHDVIIQDQKTWDLYNKSRECITSIGINPDDVITFDTNVTHAITVPEFGSSSLALTTVAIITSIVIYKRFF